MAVTSSAGRRRIDRQADRQVKRQAVDAENPRTDKDDMGCLFSCCTTDPVKAAKWKQRSTSYKKVNEKDEPPAVTYIYTPPGQEGKDVPDHQVDTSGVSSEGNDRGMVETKVIVVNAYKTTTTTTTKVISDAYDERFEETASLRESLDPGEKAPDLPQGVVESHVISQTQIQTVIEHHDEYDDDDMKPSECVTNDEASDGEAAGAASARAAGTGDEDERGEDAQSERDEDGKNERSEDAANEGLGQTDEDASSRLPQELRLEVADIDNVDATASQFQSKTVLVFTETPVMSDEESLEGVLRGLIAVEDFNVASPESTDEISDDNAEISQDNAEGETPNESDRWIGPFSPKQTAAAECDDGSDSFPLVYSQIDIDVIRKIWEDLVPNGDVAPLGVKILLR